LAGLAAAALLWRLGREEPALGAALTATVANAMMLAAFRQPERPLAQTMTGVGRSWAGWGMVTGVLVAAEVVVKEWANGSVRARDQ
jgi:hypothetical protein